MIFTGTVGKQVLRTFNAGWNIGYSRNRGIQVNGTTSANETFDYWFTGVNVSHALETNHECLSSIINYNIPEYGRLGLYRTGMRDERDTQSNYLWIRMAQAADPILGAVETRFDLAKKGMV